VKGTTAKDYKIFLTLLRNIRKEENLSQIDLAKKLGKTQTFISKCERGERRIDAVELLMFCTAMGIDFSEFAKKLQTAIGRKPLK